MKSLSMLSRLQCQKQQSSRKTNYKAPAPVETQTDNVLTPKLVNCHPAIMSVPVGRCETRVTSAHIFKLTVMEKVTITLESNGWKVQQGDKYADTLCYEEMLGVLISLTKPEQTPLLAMDALQRNSTKRI
jgi:hypothetical protein